MVKGLLSGVSRGFLYTIGKILAFLFIGLVIGTLLTKIDVDPVAIKEIARSVLC